MDTNKHITIEFRNITSVTTICEDILYLTMLHKFNSVSPICMHHCWITGVTAIGKKCPCKAKVNERTPLSSIKHHYDLKN